MQKQVSKHGLTILALSLLLALSLALTATLAAFSATKTVSGRIIFAGSVEITLNDNGSPAASSRQGATLDETVYTIQITVDLDDPTSITLDNVTNALDEIKFDGKGKAFNWQIQLVENNTDSDTTQPGVSIDLKTGNAGNLGYVENTSTGVAGSEIVDGVEWAGSVVAGATSIFETSMAEIFAAVDFPVVMANIATDANDEPKAQAIDLILRISTGAITPGTARV